LGKSMNVVIVIQLCRRTRNIQNILRRTRNITALGPNVKRHTLEYVIFKGITKHINLNINVVVAIYFRAGIHYEYISGDVTEAVAQRRNPQLGHTL
uniref:Ovule protein n=1 Tax=Loa loa TaxID=7209 RepID=A0A1I7VA95_LOALO